MPTSFLRSRPGALSALFHPIQKILEQLLADGPDQPLGTAVRPALVAAADALLVRQFPLARLVPPEVRQRLIRKQLDLIIDEVLLNKNLPAESAGTGVESLIVQAARGTADPAAAVERAVRQLPGGAWSIARLPLDDRSFEVRPTGLTVSVQEAWAAAHQLKAAPGIAQAEPNILVPLGNLPADDAPAAQAKSLFGQKHLPGSAAPDWSLEKINVPRAWQKAATDGRPAKGEGVLVGHPDTGYTRHPENWSDDPAQRRLLFEFGWDFWKKDSDPTDDLESALGSILTAGMVGNPGHGTGTSSVIFSGAGAAPGGGATFVSGIAPRAKLIPFRVAPSVVVWDQRRLADAIKAATDAGCHVISISMGGLPLGYLQQAVLYAAERGVIVCAAAGNIFGANDVLHAVVWPAAYSEVLAVAASNAVNAPWKGSSRGPQVDITAPGESVWHATAKKGQPLRDVGRGHGTSFAVATTAGVAALWLAYHGRDKLLATYGAARLAAVFRQIVVTQGFVRPAGWKTDLFGAGIIDALKVLSAPLPPATALATKAVIKQARFDQFASLFDDVPRSALRRGLAAFLGTTEALLPARLEEVGDELIYHFFSDGQLRSDFRAQLTGSKNPAKTKSKTKPTANPAKALAHLASPQLAARLSTSP